MQFQQSYGASGDQSRKVAAGATADFVNFSVEPDITRLVDAGLVAKDWNANQYKGIPFGSVVTIVVRKGNPKGIKDWDDLLKPGVEVVTPNPFSSGSAKWNLLAPYAAKSDGGKDPQAGLAYIEQAGDRPRQGAAEVGPRGDRDVPAGHRRRAAQLRERGAVRRAQRRPGGARHAADDVQDREPHRGAQQEQEPRARPRRSTTSSSRRRPRSCGRRPASARSTRRWPRSSRPTSRRPQKLWTIDDLGGWKTVDGTLFKKETGSIAVIYDKATS